MKAFLIFSSLIFVTSAQFANPQYGSLGRFVRGGFGFGNGGGGGGGRGIGGPSGGGGGGYGGPSQGNFNGGGFGGGSPSGGYSGGGSFGGSGEGGGFGAPQGGFRPSPRDGGFHEGGGGGGGNEIQEGSNGGGKIHKYVSIHVAPQEPASQRPSRPFQTKERETHYQIVFIKAPHSNPGEAGEIQLPPPPQTKTLVYVLLKKNEIGDTLRLQKQSAVRPSKPEVYFIRYKGGDKNSNGGGDGKHGGGGGDFGPGGAEGPGGSSGPSGESPQYGSF